MSRDRKHFIYGTLAILAYFSIEQIDAIYFIPHMKEMSLNSAVECHDINKCWIKKMTKKEAAK